MFDLDVLGRFLKGRWVIQNTGPTSTKNNVLALVAAKYGHRGVDLATERGGGGVFKGRLSQSE